MPATIAATFTTPTTRIAILKTSSQVGPSRPLSIARRLLATILSPGAPRGKNAVAIDTHAVYEDHGRDPARPRRRRQRRHPRRDRARAPARVAAARRFVRRRRGR